MNEDERNSLQEIITQALDEMKQEQGNDFNLGKVNLAELSRRTHISRGKLRKIKADGFVVKPNAHTGRQKPDTVLSGYTGIIDSFLAKNVRNSNTIFGALKDVGYNGGKTQLKTYIHNHQYLLPAKREVVASQGNRGRRYKSDPGEQFQMDWGFVNIDTQDGSYRAACFAMVCHHCGFRYVEFFPNAKQENLFIGIIHAFQRMGIPKCVLTDNMKSVVIGRDADGHPLWNHEYEAFMETVGFKTKLCKPRHPFTKGAVERLIRFVKDSFVNGRTFGTITDLNYEALKWCSSQNGVHHDGVDCVPAREHAERCSLTTKRLTVTDDIRKYLCVERKISFDGFVNFEGRRFGVPYRYTEKICRIARKDFTVYIFSDDMSQLLAKHDVTWSRRDSFCKDQYKPQPEEFPTAPVAARMSQSSPSIHDSSFDRFNFDKEGC